MIGPLALEIGDTRRRDTPLPPPPHASPSPPSHGIIVRPIHDRGLGVSEGRKLDWKGLFSKGYNVNVLSAARFFLFGSRDVWFEIGLPLFLRVELGWKRELVGLILAGNKWGNSKCFRRRPDDSDDLVCFVQSTAVCFARPTSKGETDAPSRTAIGVRSRPLRGFLSPSVSCVSLFGDLQKPHCCGGHVHGSLVLRMPVFTIGAFKIAATLYRHALLVSLKTVVIFSLSASISEASRIHRALFLSL